MSSVNFHNISDWNLLHGLKPLKGTRPQCIFEKSDAQERYYFKESRDVYPTEIWSEIIASKIGQLIGFNVLDYNLAIYKDRIGCLSKSMVNVSKGERLSHGIDILQDFLPDFKISERPVFSFQNGIKLETENPYFKNFKSNLIKLLLFDALIGNTDRHTENWGFIWKEKKVKNEEKVLTRLKNLFIYPDKQRIMLSMGYEFAPIYDSGSCLGREIVDEKIDGFLKDEQQLTTYIERANSEIRWEGNQLKLFGIIKKLYESERKETIEYAKSIFQKKEEIKQLIERTDVNLILNSNQHRALTEKRKELIIRLLFKRIEILQKIITID